MGKQYYSPETLRRIAERGRRHIVIDPKTKEAIVITKRISGTTTQTFKDIEEANIAAKRAFGVPSGSPERGIIKPVKEVKEIPETELKPVVKQEVFIPYESMEETAAKLRHDIMIKEEEERIKREGLGLKEFKPTEKEIPGFKEDIISLGGSLERQSKIFATELWPTTKQLGKDIVTVGEKLYETPGIVKDFWGVRPKTKEEWGSFIDYSKEQLKMIPGVITGVGAGIVRKGIEEPGKTAAELLVTGAAFSIPGKALSKFSKVGGISEGGFKGTLTGKELLGEEVTAGKFVEKGLIKQKEFAVGTRADVAGILTKEKAFALKRGDVSVKEIKGTKYGDPIIKEFESAELIQPITKDVSIIGSTTRTGGKELTEGLTLSKEISRRVKGPREEIKFESFGVVGTRGNIMPVAFKSVVDITKISGKDAGVGRIIKAVDKEGVVGPTVMKESIVTPKTDMIIKELEKAGSKRTQEEFTSTGLRMEAMDLGYDKRMYDAAFEEPSTISKLKTGLGVDTKLVEDSKLRTVVVPKTVEELAVTPKVSQKSMGLVAEAEKTGTLEKVGQLLEVLPKQDTKQMIKPKVEVGLKIKTGLRGFTDPGFTRMLMDPLRGAGGRRMGMVDKATGLSFSVEFLRGGLWEKSIYGKWPKKQEAMRFGGVASLKSKGIIGFRIKPEKIIGRERLKKDLPSFSKMSFAFKGIGGTFLEKGSRRKKRGKGMFGDLLDFRL